MDGHYAAVQWRERHVRCCGQDIVIGDTDYHEPPVWWNDPHGWAATTKQCGNCGTRYAADIIQAE